MKRKTGILQIILLCSLFTACSSGQQDDIESQRVEQTRTEAASESEAGRQEVTETESGQDTTNKNIVRPEGMTVETRFDTPEGYTRTACDEDSFGSFLRNYPLLPDGEKVHLYDGSEKGNQNDHIAVFDMELTEGDLQQCADSILRLYAEYFYQTNQYSRMNFHLTNGFELSFDEWRKGKRVSVDGNRTNWVSSASASDSREVFDGYLRFLFCYAGTLSMGRECEPEEIKDIQAGDVFLYAGSPGHVVLVLDVCEDDNGNRAFLLGQGYMPAQQFHVLKNPAHGDEPWYYVEELEYPFRTPEYTFYEGSFLRPLY